MQSDLIPSNSLTSYSQTFTFWYVMPKGGRLRVIRRDEPSAPSNQVTGAPPIEAATAPIITLEAPAATTATWKSIRIVGLRVTSAAAEGYRLLFDIDYPRDSDAQSLVGVDSFYLSGEMRKFVPRPTSDFGGGPGDVGGGRFFDDDEFEDDESDEDDGTLPWWLWLVIVGVLMLLIVVVVAVYFLR